MSNISNLAEARGPEGYNNRIKAAVRGMPCCTVKLWMCSFTRMQKQRICGFT